MKTERLCSPLKSDPSRVDYTELTPSVAGLVDVMIEDSDPRAEHTLAQTSNQHGGRSIFGLQQTDWGTFCFYLWAILSPEVLL